MRIISVVPSITELLFDLNLESQIIGRTKFCIHPNAKVKTIPQFGGTKNLHIDKIIDAKPDLIIANKEENLKSEIEALQHYFDVLVTDISDLEENNQMILEVGERTNRKAIANEIVEKIVTEFAKLTPILNKPTVLYLIWKNPLMSIGNDTFIHNMLAYAGFENVCGKQIRYPEIQPSSNIEPDFIFLSSEPFPFKEKHLSEVQEMFPKAKCILVDGEMFSWYGSRMKFAPNYFLDLKSTLHFS